MQVTIATITYETGERTAFETGCVALPNGVPYRSHAVRFRSVYTVRGVQREVEVPLFSSKKVSLAGTPSVGSSFSRPPPYDLGRVFQKWV